MFGVIPAATPAAKPAVLFRIRLLFLAIGIADAIARRESPSRIICPDVPYSCKEYVAVQDAGILVAVPARAGIPEKSRLKYFSRSLRR